MAYQALYRKYRPHNFEDFIDQNNTKKILINSILNDKISHAYLFSGSRGEWDLQRTCLGVTTEEDIKYKLPNTVFL